VFPRISIDHHSSTQRVRRRDLTDDQPIPRKRYQRSLEPQLPKVAAQPSCARRRLSRSVMDLDPVTLLQVGVPGLELRIDQKRRSGP
jgi:hypothetical protein